MLKVYPPEGADDGTSVDIIAIHGLGTTTPRTWEYKTKTGSVFNWLSDSNMLPDIVSSARIYTFSWNARYYADASVARIENVAEVLLSVLQSQRDKGDEHSRPLIFVASCFGGLIVTKALEIANIHNSQYRKLLVANSGVVFLGSPLQGTKAGKAAQWRAMLGGILNKEPSQTLLQDLDGSTRALRETSEKFVAMVTTPPMRTMTVCFWESQKTKVLKAFLPARTLRLGGSVKMILVQEDSACLFGRPKQLLDAPHSLMNKFSGPSDANFGLVSSAIKKMVEEAKRIAISQREAFHLHNEHFMVSRRLNPFFTGREEELRKLKQALCASHSTTGDTAARKTYVIHGMGGAGKSEVALKFAHENRPEFWGIFWIDGRSKSSIISGFGSIARTCGLPDESLEGAMAWLQNTSHSWLLIIDNADNKDLDLSHFFPAGRNGSILITTRLPECAKYQTVGNADGYESLSQETAIELLFKACCIEESLRGAQEHNARAVTELLGCHALAVIQAGAAISQNLCDLGEYKDIFLNERRTLLQCFPKQAGSEYGGVYATFEVSATYLETRDDQTAKDALQLLNFYAFMHFTDFPEEAFEEAWKNSRNEDVVFPCLLSDEESNEVESDEEESDEAESNEEESDEEESDKEGSDDGEPDDEEYIQLLAPWHVSHLPNFLQRNLHNDNLDKMRLRKARSLLASLSLVVFDSANGTTRMHPVSHFWSRDRLQKPEERMNAGLNGLSVLSLSIEDPFTVDVSPLVSQLQPHIESIAHSLKEWDTHRCNFHFQQSVYRLSWVLYKLKCESGLFRLLQFIPVQLNESWIRTENGQKIQKLHGICMFEFRDANKAVTLLEILNEARVNTLAAEDSKCLESQHELAKAYLKIEKTAKAVELLERIVHTRTETLYPEHEDLLHSQHELARAYLHIGETTKAISLLETVVEIKERTLRIDHPSRMTSIYVLAQCHHAAGNYERALELARSIENVVQNRQRQKLADWNAELIGYILEDMELEEPN